MPRSELNEIFQNIYDPTSASIRTSDAASSFQQKGDYDGRTDDNPVYVGQAIKGLPTSSDGWLITKNTYDSSNRWIGSETTVGAWDNRASLF